MLPLLVSSLCIYNIKYRILLCGSAGDIYRITALFSLCILMLKNTNLGDTLLGFMGVITLCIFTRKNTLLMVAMQIISKTCECLKKYWTRILPWTIQKQNVFILEGHRSGNQRQIIKSTKQSRMNIFGNTNKTKYLQRKSGTQRTYKEGQHTYAHHVTTSTIKINKGQSS